MTDFAVDVASRPHFVYRLRSTNTGRLVYIGCTVDIDRRLTEHRSMLTSEPVDVEVAEYPDLATAREAERQAIEAEQPAGNIYLTEARHQPIRDPRVDTDETVSLAVAARALGIHPKTFRRMAREGRAPVPVVFLGARRRVPCAALRAVAS